MIIDSNQRNNILSESSELIWNMYCGIEAGRILINVSAQNQLPAELYKEYALAVGDVILGFYSIQQLPALLQERILIDELLARKITADLIDFLSPVEQIQSINAGYAAAASTLTPNAFTDNRTTIETIPTVEDSALEAIPQSTVPLAPEPNFIPNPPTQSVPVQTVITPAEPPPVDPVPPKTVTPASITPSGQVATPAQPIIEPLHTMQSDMDIIRGHQANTQVGYQSSEKAEQPQLHRYQKPLTEAPDYQTKPPIQK